MLYMSFIPIELENIRPYVRFLITTENWFHQSAVYAFEHRLIYILEGEAKCIIKGNNNPVLLTKNDALLISADVNYKMLEGYKNKVAVIYFDLTMENFHLKERIKPTVERIGETHLFCKYRLLFKNKTFNYLVINNAASAHKHINRCIRYFNENIGGVYKDTLLSGLMICAIGALLEQLEKCETKNSISKVANLAIEYIQKNYKNKITLENISENINFHRSYANRCIKAETGYSLHEYLNNYRLEKAVNLLMYSDMSVGQIAEETGFENSAYFSAVFKKHYGISPSDMNKK